MPITQLDIVLPALLKSLKDPVDSGPLVTAADAIGRLGPDAKSTFPRAFGSLADGQSDRRLCRPGAQTH